MRKLLIYLKDFRRDSVLAPLFKLLEAAFDLIVPLVVAKIINSGIARQDSGYVLRLCGVLVLLGLVGLACSVTAQYFAARAAVGFSARLRRALFGKIQSLSYSELDEVGTATLVTRMTSDINQVQNGVNLVLRLFLRSPFIVFGAMVMAFTIDVRSALVFAGAIPLLLLVVFGILLLTMPLYQRVQQRLDRVTLSTRENLTGVRVIRAFCREEEESAEFDRRNETLSRIQQSVGRISALMNPLTYVLINLAVILLIRTGAHQVDVGLLDQGSVVALYNYMAQILVELIKLANLIITISKSLACAKRIQGVLDLQPSLERTAPAAAEPQAAKVEFRGVALRYHGAGADALTGISFRAAPGETIGIIGGTGSGKSSLVGLIPHFYDATAGTVLVDGVDVKSQDPEALRKKIGIVPQKAVLFQGTIRENLLWGDPNADTAALRQALEVSQAAEIVAGKEGGLDAPVEQGGKNFSGGQRQRLTIARALTRRPEILILDDSASALDFATDARLRQAIRSLSPRPTTFIVSQRTASIRRADRILVLDDGALVGIGTHEELLRTCPVYQEIHNSQYAREEA